MAVPSRTTKTPDSVPGSGTEYFTTRSRTLAGQRVAPSAAVASEWQPPDIHPVERLSRGFVPGFPEAYELDVHAFIDEDFGRPTRSIIRGVIREEQDGG